VRADRAAFDAYAAIKLEGARLAASEGEEGKKVSEYKARKHVVCMDIMARAKEWAAVGDAEGA
jgi:hypothetical protein